MGRVLDAGTAAGAGVLGAANVANVPLGGFVDAFGVGAGLKPLNTSIRRADYPDMDAAFPFDGAAGRYFEINRNAGMPNQADSTGNLLCLTRTDAGLWVAGGENGKVWISSDGISWAVIQTAGTVDIRAITYGNGILSRATRTGRF